MRAAEAEGGGGFGAAEASRVVETLVRYYGVTMHGDIFNCDPHPGNLLVDRASGDLVVLDWGQARRLSTTERAAHARLFLAIMMEDVNLLGDACAARSVALRRRAWPQSKTTRSPLALSTRRLPGCGSQLKMSPCMVTP